MKKFLVAGALAVASVGGIAVAEGEVSATASGCSVAYSASIASALCTSGTGNYQALGYPRLGFVKSGPCVHIGTISRALNGDPLNPFIRAGVRSCS